LKKKTVDLEMGHELLNTQPPLPGGDKKVLAAERKKLKEWRDRRPISISVAFKVPWWAV